MSPKPLRWYLILTAVLVVLSAGFYALQILVFHDARDTFFYMLQDLAFVPVQVLLVTLILNDLMARRERRERLQKMNMVIGAFFSEFGYVLVKTLRGFDGNAQPLAGILGLGSAWGPREFAAARTGLRSHRPRIEPRTGGLSELKVLLTVNKSFLLGLLENQSLLEHASFTDLLWAVSHLTEELEFRKNMRSLPKADLDHLSHDIRRAYSLLLAEWLSYVEHLRTAYPYIYSLVVRTNPFDPNASVVVKQ